MQDRLKQFVDDHRAEFEAYQPREALWEGVNERLRRGRSRALWQRWAIAASVLLVLSCGTWLVYTYHSTKSSDTSISTLAPTTRAEVYYSAVTQFLDAELQQYCVPQPELCREFERDLESLNNDYHELKTEYAMAADKRAILQAMTKNLQLQVQLISRQLQIMETVTQKKAEMTIM
jgi:hypothetical protein